MPVTVGGQEFSGRVNVNVFPDTREEFEVEANKLFALNSDDFDVATIRKSGSTVWVSRESQEGRFTAVDITVFAPDGVTKQDVTEHMRGSR